VSGVPALDPGGTALQDAQHGILVVAPEGDNLEPATAPRCLTLEGDDLVDHSPTVRAAVDQVTDQDDTEPGLRRVCCHIGADCQDQSLQFSAVSMDVTDGVTDAFVTRRGGHAGSGTGT
jgi:hypothetical protein